MKFLDDKIYFPTFEFIFYTFIAIIISVAVIQFSDTKYVFERFYGQFTTENSETEKRLESQKESSIESADSEKLNLTLQADIVTFILWGIVGAFLYWVCKTFYVAFINPFVEDTVESNYINANRKQLIIKRIVWILAVFFTFLLLAITIFTFRSVILTYYTLVIYDTSLSSLTMFLIGTTLTTLMIAVLRVGMNIVAKTY